MEAVGGQGANSAGKILAEAAVLGMGYTGNHFSSFGSEKRGTPVRSFVRFSPAKLTVRSAAPIVNPDLLVVFHEAMLRNYAHCVEGVLPSTDLLINSPKVPENIELIEGVTVRNIITIDATALARKYDCGLNAIMLGACSKYVPEMNSDRLRETVARFFAKLPPEELKRNLAGFAAGEKSTKSAHFRPSQACLPIEPSMLPRLGWVNAPIGGVITNPGNTILKDNKVSRTGVVPRFIPETCFNCGYCDMICPDYCFVWDRTDPKLPTLKGIDYQYCKACQKCIEVCPVQALVPIAEADLTADEQHPKLFRKLGDKT